MSVKNRVLIISGESSFLNKYKEYLANYGFLVDAVKKYQDWEVASGESKYDFCVIDNLDDNFPFVDFIQFLNHHNPQLFLINIGKNPVYASNTPYLIYTVDDEKESLPLQYFLENLDEVLKRQKARIELASMLIHDIRSPLNSLVGYLELLLNETFGELNEGQKNILEKAMDLGDTTFDLLEDINEIYQSEQHLFRLEKIPFDFHEVLETVLVNLWVQADNKNIQIKKDIPIDLKPLYGDDYQIQRVLTNLISNSIKYCPSNSQVIIGAHARDEQFAEIAVSDNGGGVPENHLPRLFDKYFRIHSGKDFQKGYGLGLYICKLIVKSHKGKIWANNNERGGLTITFSIPFSNK